MFLPNFWFSFPFLLRPFRSHFNVFFLLSLLPLIHNHPVYSIRNDHQQGWTLSRLLVIKRGLRVDLNLVDQALP